VLDSGEDVEVCECADNAEEDDGFNGRVGCMDGERPEDCSHDRHGGLAGNLYAASGGGGGGVVVVARRDSKQLVVVAYTWCKQGRGREYGVTIE